jgi:hypothetical protein
MGGRRLGQPSSLRQGSRAIRWYDERAFQARRTAI